MALGVLNGGAVQVASAQTSADVQLAVLQYRGGGDWYANPTAVPNLVDFCNTEMGMSLSEEVPYVEVGSPDLFNHPWVHMTGHGNVLFSNREAEQLRTYLQAGGFLHISDNYGMDIYVRAAMAKVFPDAEWVEVPFDHPVYHQQFDFAQGLPKIHEHDDLPPRGFGLFHKEGWSVFTTTNATSGRLGGLPSAPRPGRVRLEALRMGPT